MNITYQVEKEKAREVAMKWQADFNNRNYSYNDLIVFQRYFETIAKRYGLIKEFKENGII